MTTSNTPMLRLVQVSRVFETDRRQVIALDHVSFDVAPGEVACLVGTSGCGKSTLLAMVAGLDMPTAGVIELNGRPVTGSGTDRGMVFQRDCLFPWLSVRDNVGFSLKLSANRSTFTDAKEAKQRIDALIAEVGLTEFADALPRQLSGGMRQRAAIARALANRPQILLMDEPFGALDAQTRESMQDLLLRVVADHGTTVLFITHDVEEAVYLGDRVLVMSARPGRIVHDERIALAKPRESGVKLRSAFGEVRRRILDFLHKPDSPRVRPGVATVAV